MLRKRGIVTLADKQLSSNLPSLENTLLFFDWNLIEAELACGEVCYGSMNAMIAGFVPALISYSVA